jgi:hypothetical protein
MSARGLVLMASLVASVAGAQSIPGAVLAKNEPHHHPAYEDGVLRVLRVSVPGGDSTMLHEHDPDYFWIALGASEVVNAKLGAADAVISSADLSIHYTLGHFAHVARNPGRETFNNITVELLEPQSGPRNLCEVAIANTVLDCPRGDARPASGVEEHAAFQTDRLRVSLVTLAPGAALTGVEPWPAPWVIALDPSDVSRGLRAREAGSANPSLSANGMNWRGGVWRPAPNRRWSLNNTTRAAVRVLVVTPTSR